MTEPGQSPALPPGRHVHLAGRGTTFVREAGPRDAWPPLVLLHGWTATADLNWFGSYWKLAERYRLVALDLRGHGRGIRSEERFSLEACAEDVLALAAELDLGPFVPIGYSMGGLVAQLVWRESPDDVLGLVLAATARNFQGTVGDRVYFGGLGTLARAYRRAPSSVRDQAINRYLTRRTGRLDPWAAAEVTSGDHRAYLEAGTAIGSFSSHGWISEVDVPCAVIVTTRDRSVPPWRQRRLAETIVGAHVFEVDGDHRMVATEPDRFAVVLADACRWVEGQLGGEWAAG